MILNVELVEVEVNRCNPLFRLMVVALLLTVNEVSLYKVGHVALAVFAGLFNSLAISKYF